VEIPGVEGPSGASGNLLGVVSPEGVVNAEVGQFYINTTTDDLWYKKTGVGITNTGWAQLIGNPP